MRTHATARLLYDCQSGWFSCLALTPACTLSLLTQPCTYVQHPLRTRCRADASRSHAHPVACSRLAGPSLGRCCRHSVNDKLLAGCYPSPYPHLLFTHLAKQPGACPHGTPHPEPPLHSTPPVCTYIPFCFLSLKGTRQRNSRVEKTPAGCRSRARARACARPACTRFSHTQPVGGQRHSVPGPKEIAPASSRCCRELELV